MGPKRQPFMYCRTCGFEISGNTIPGFSQPEISAVSAHCLQTNSARKGNYFFYHQGGEQLFCENETNNQRMYHRANDYPYVKDGINNYVIDKETTVNPGKNRHQSGYLAQRKNTGRWQRQPLRCGCASRRWTIPGWSLRRYLQSACRKQMHITASLPPNI